MSSCDWVHHTWIGNRSINSVINPRIRSIACSVSWIPDHIEACTSHLQKNLGSSLQVLQTLLSLLSLCFVDFHHTWLCTYLDRNRIHDNLVMINQHTFQNWMFVQFVWNSSLREHINTWICTWPSWMRGFWSIMMIQFKKILCYMLEPHESHKTICIS